MASSELKTLVLNAIDFLSFGFSLHRRGFATLFWDKDYIDKMSIR